MNIKAGETLPLRDLLMGLMMVSGNDAANVIAQYIGGTVPEFMKKLNAYLKTIGCEKTFFTNPHGLFHPDHKTTAYDLAVMMREAIKDPFFREIIGTVTYTRPKTNKQEASTLLQSNALIRRGAFFYPKAMGGKTGAHLKAGSCFVAVAQDRGRTLIAVLLKNKSRKQMFRDTIHVFEVAFQQPPAQKRLVKAGPLKVAPTIEGAGSHTKAYLKEDVVLEYYPAEEPQTRCVLSWDHLTLPIKKDQRIGEIAIQNEKGITLLTAPVLAQNDVSDGLWHRFKKLVIRKEGEGTSPLIKGVIVALVSLVFVALALQIGRR